MVHPAGALRGDAPEVEGRFHELVVAHPALPRQALRLARLDGAGAIEPALRRDDHSLGHVAQHGVDRRAERPPGARPRRAFSLRPDHLAPEEQPEVVLQYRDHVGRQAAVWLASQVRDVHGESTARLEHLDTAREHVPQHLQVLEVRARDAVATERLLVGLAREVRRRRDDERHRVGRKRELTRIRRHDGVVERELEVGVDRVVVREVGRTEARVEVGGVMALAAPNPEPARRSRPLPGAHRALLAGAGVSGAIRSR